MALPKFGRKGLRDWARKAWDCVTEQDGTVDKQKARNQLKAFLSENVELIDLDGLAGSAIDALDRDLRPRHDPQQLSFFQPETFIPYGPQQRVRMSEATRQHLAQYGDILAENWAGQMAAYQQASGYVRTRLAAWETDDKTLSDVERRAFGHTGWCRPHGLVEDEAGASNEHR